MKKKLILSYILIILFISGISGFFSIHMYDGFYKNEFKNHLLKESGILSDILIGNKNSLNNEYFEDFVRQYGDKLDKNGNVLADSQKDKSIMENHMDRAEVKKALAGEKNVQTRYSKSIGAEYIYSAEAVDINGEKIVLRLSVPLISLHNMQRQIVFYIISGIIISAGVVLLYAYILSDRITKPIDELTLLAKEISKGNYSKRIVIKNGNDQISELTNSFNYMSERLTETVDALENENIKLDSILNSLMNGVIAIDKNNNILMINSVFRDFFKLPKDIIGKIFIAL